MYSCDTCYKNVQYIQTKHVNLLTTLKCIDYSKCLYLIFKKMHIQYCIGISVYNVLYKAPSTFCIIILAEEQLLSIFALS